MITKCAWYCWRFPDCVYTVCGCHKFSRWRLKRRQQKGDKQAVRLRKKRFKKPSASAQAGIFNPPSDDDPGNDTAQQATVTPKADEDDESEELVWLGEEPEDGSPEANDLENQATKEQQTAAIEVEIDTQSATALEGEVDNEIVPIRMGCLLKWFEEVESIVQPLPSTMSSSRSRSLPPAPHRYSTPTSRSSTPTSRSSTSTSQSSLTSSSPHSLSIYRSPSSYKPSTDASTCSAHPHPPQATDNIGCLNSAKTLKRSARARNRPRSLHLSRTSGQFLNTFRPDRPSVPDGLLRRITEQSDLREFYREGRRGLRGGGEIELGSDQLRGMSRKSPFESWSRLRTSTDSSSLVAQPHLWVDTDIPITPPGDFYREIQATIAARMESVQGLIPTGPIGSSDGERTYFAFRLSVMRRDSEGVAIRLTTVLMRGNTELDRLSETYELSELPRLLESVRHMTSDRKEMVPDAVLEERMTPPIMFGDNRWMTDRELMGSLSSLQLMEGRRIHDGPLGAMRTPRPLLGKDGSIATGERGEEDRVKEEEGEFENIKDTLEVFHVPGVEGPV